MAEDRSESRSGATAFLGLMTAPLVLSVIFYAALAARDTHSGSYGITLEVLFLVPFFSATVLSIIASRTSKVSEARFWMLLAAVSGLMTASEVIAAVAHLTSGGYDSWALLTMVLHTLAVCLFVPLMIVMTRLWGSTLPLRTRYIADAFIFATVAMLGVYGFAVNPWYEALGLTSQDALLASAKSAFGVMLVAGTLVSGFLVVGSLWRTWERILAAGIVIYGVATMFAPVWHAYVDAGFGREYSLAVEVGWTAGFAVIAIAAAHRVVTPAASWDRRAFFTFDMEPPYWAPATIVGVALFSIPAMSALAYRDPDSWAMVAVVGSGLLAVLLLVRTAAMSIQLGRSHREARMDHLTGLGNRIALDEAVTDAVDAAAHSDSGSVSLIAIDFDAFSEVDLTVGRDEADGVLQAVGAYLKSTVPSDSRAFRTAGDYFVVLVSDAPAGAVRSLAERLRAGFADIARRKGLSLTASVGLASFPSHADDSTVLMERSAAAHRAAKRMGGDQCLSFADMRADEGHSEVTVDSRARSAVRFLATVVDGRIDPTDAHSRNVARLASRLGRALGLSVEEVELLELAGSVHDVGKMAISTEVLAKPAALNHSEMQEVRQHSELGERILEILDIRAVLPWIRFHHERWDGTGYPDGIAGEEIPLESRILAVCDAYEAMTNDRPYRPRMSPAAALQQIDLHMGTQFDPHVADVFIRMMSGVPGTLPKRLDEVGHIARL